MAVSGVRERTNVVLNWLGRSDIRFWKRTRICGSRSGEGSLVEGAPASQAGRARRRSRLRSTGRPICLSAGL